jgi:serine/threonine-protein kinase SRPK3
MRMHDSFQISGPNGTHDSLVLELLGPSVANILDADSGIERLPGTLARTIAKQTLLGLCFLHEQKITHAGILTSSAFI